MPTPASPKSKMSTLEFLATFVILFVVLNFGLKYIFPNQFGDKPANQPAVEVVMQAATIREGNDPVLVIHNNTDTVLPLAKRCPQPPVDVAFLEKKADGSHQPRDLMANTVAGECVAPASVAAHSSATISLAPWKYALFSQLGSYQISLDVPDGFAGSGHALAVTTHLTITEPNVFTKLFRTFVEKPLLNSLLWISSFMPGHNLGLAIILLTIIVKFILLVPNQHALEGQRKLQMLQPKLDELKKKYADDPKKQQEETMRLWKEFNINPLQSCLPTLLQFPILIGLFYVIKSGATIETSRHLLYSYFLNKPFTLGYTFLGINLLHPNVWIFPPLLVILQFIQVKMMMAKAKKKADIIDVGPKKRFQMPEMNQQTIMMYVLPFMIGFFAIKFPAAVAIYWGISTLFGIAQQMYVNREKIRLAK